MTNILVDINHPDSEQTFRLCHLLGNDLADAIPVRLWAYALRTQNRRGFVCATPAQIASIVRWPGDAKKLVAALTDAEFLEPENGGFRIKGWDRNERYFSERDRLRKLREGQKRTHKKRVRDADKTEHSSSSSSSPIDLKINGGTRARDAQSSEMLFDHSVSSTDAAELVEHWQLERGKRGEPRTLVVPSAWLWQAKRIVAAANGLAQAKAVVTAYVSDTANAYWQKRKWQLDLLARDEDFAQALLLVGSTSAESTHDFFQRMIAEADEAEKAKRGPT